MSLTISHIGPPGVRLEAEDKAILVYISRPGQGGNMWATDTYNFRYKIVIWQRSSGVRQIINTTYYTERILKLLPETTYCLKVQAIHFLFWKHSNYSAVQCINTTVADKMPVPENIEVDADGESYVLRWDYASPNVSFRAQWLPTDAVIPRPVVAVTPTRDSLLVYVSCQESSSSKCHGVTYEIIYWENTSKAYTAKMKDSPEFTIDNLKPLTVYCVQARVLLFATAWNQSSNFSDKLCKQTRPGNSSQIWIMIGLIIVIFSVLVLVLYAGRGLLKYLSCLNFSSPKPPLSIDEFFSEPPSKSLLFLTPDSEHTERCFIIENTDTVAVVEENHAPEEDHKKYSSQTSQDSGNYSHAPEEDHKKYSSQTSQDSGNYSNEEENTGSESGEGLRP
ncbi:hypothetical protein A6R68_08791 [Neotoma lepida]|uniref:Fibronectin type-III domain-containing protein n=1 Tax=Neotoma lepida TaxID=56216 RepID=A0A1A6G3X4_NEOLE|nr:hypothetical protein A6R68_08791 [Neotoma lepida]